jgi:hypothetical protein
MRDLDQRFQLLWSRLYNKSCPAYRKVDLNLKRYAWEAQYPDGLQRCSFATELNEVKYVFSNLILYAAATFQYIPIFHKVNSLNRRNILISLHIEQKYTQSQYLGFPSKVSVSLFMGSMASTVDETLLDTKGRAVPLGGEVLASSMSFLSKFHFGSVLLI